MRDYVYDSGALIAIDSRRDDAAVRRHLNRLTARDHIMVPVPVAAQVVRLLDERAPRELSMAVIAMYAEQVERLRQALGRRKFKRTVKIDTVDSFEGREEDIVVISLVRSNERGRIGFLRVPNRLNVAISRAKRLVACIGDSATLRSGDESMYGMLVEASRSTGGWLSALELVSQPKQGRGAPRPQGEGATTPTRVLVPTHGVLRPRFANSSLASVPIFSAWMTVLQELVPVPSFARGAFAWIRSS